MSHKQLLLDGSFVVVYSPEEWIKLFTQHCDKIYFERGGTTGEYCCGYHWCCDECEQKEQEGCRDCVITMIDILRSFGYEPDYSETDFDAIEERIKGLYEIR